MLDEVITSAQTARKKGKTVDIYRMVAMVVERVMRWKCALAYTSPLIVSSNSDGRSW